MNRPAARTCLGTLLLASSAFAQGTPAGAPDKAAPPAAEETEPDATAADRPETAPDAPTPPPAGPPPAAPPAQPGPPPSPWALRPGPAPGAAPGATHPVVDEAPRELLPPAEPPGWTAWVGMRTGFVASPGFDPFAESDLLLQGSLGVSRSFLVSKPLSFAGVLAFDGGGRRATARGEVTSLQAYRLMLGPEARWHLLPELYLFGRPSAGVLRTVASLEEGSTGTTLYARDWLLALDATVGGALAFWDLRSKSQDFRPWLVADGGYGWAPSSELSLQPDADGSAPKRTASLELGSLALRGPFFRVAVAASF